MKFSQALLAYLIAYDEWKAVKGSKVYDLPRFKVVLEKGAALDAVVDQLGPPFASTKPRRPK